MKKILLQVFFAFPLFMQGQQLTTKEDCKDCKLDCLCHSFFAPYIGNAGLMQKIHNNWNEFLGEDLEASFPASKGVKTISLKFDGMGCVYPLNKEIVNGIKEEILDEGLADTYFEKNSFFQLYYKKTQKKGSKLINEFIKKSNLRFDDSDLYRISGIRYPTIPYYDFIEKWNEKFIPEWIDEFNRLLSTNKFKRIIFFIHGYNVPYSLAHLQGNVMLDSLLSFSPDLTPEDILYVRLIWPSGDNKYHQISSTECNYGNIQGPGTVKLYQYVSNRAYLASVYLRRILTNIQTNAPIDIITHSHGSTIATTALIKTTSKLHLTVDEKDKSEMYQLIVNEPLPNKQISVFLNAPSIPGVNTFSDIDTTISFYKKYFFFIGYNNNDKTLKKGFIDLLTDLAPYLSSTTLGCNYEDEVTKTKKVFAEKGLATQVIAKENSVVEEHEFFCYLHQPLFKQNLIWYLNR